MVRDVGEAVEAMREETVVGIDIETSGLNPWRDKIAVVSMYGPRSRTAAVLHTRGGIPDQLVDFIQARGKERLFVGHNLAGFDALFLSNNGVDVFTPRWYDTQVAEGATLLSGRRDLSVSLKASTSRRLGVNLKKVADHGSWMNQELTQEQVEYCLDDIVLLPRLMQEQMRKAGGGDTLRAIQTEMRVLPVTMRMTLNGLPLYEPAMAGFRRGQLRRQALYGQYLRARGMQDGTNLNSPPQTKRFFQEQGITLPNTRAETLNDLAQMGGSVGRLCRAVVEWRHANKRQAMYDDEWLDKYLIDGFIHARFWQCGTETGRYSSSDPNLQQIPRNMRRVFGRDGWTVVKADYSQIEIRIAASLAKDRVMMDDLQLEDIHRQVGSAIFQCEPRQLTADQRMLSKAMSFTLIFGGGAQGLYDYARINGANINLASVRSAINRFFERYYGLATMKNKAQALADGRRPVTLNLPTGMKRILVGSTLTATRILNSSVQGSAAAGLKFALVECERAGIARYLGCTVHDEIVGVVPEGEEGEFAETLERCMIEGMGRVMDGLVKVEVKSGPRWQ